MAQFIRNTPVETVGKKCSGVPCAAQYINGRPCRGRLYDGVLDWEHSLPESDLLKAEWHSSIADLSICLGTTLQIIPSGNLPLETAKYGGKLVICNLQPTKHDNKADLVINYYVDDILEKVMDILGIHTPVYNEDDSPTKLAETAIIDWTIDKLELLALEKVFKSKTKGVKKKRSLIKNKRSSVEVKTDNCENIDDKSKIIKLDLKETDDINGTTNNVIVNNEVRNSDSIYIDEFNTPIQVKKENESNKAKPNNCDSNSMNDMNNTASTDLNFTNEVNNVDSLILIQNTTVAIM